MLIQFNFKNFKSFRDETILDLSATDETDFSDRLVNVGDEKLLPIVAIYGANACGKSNVYQAFSYMSKYVVESFKYGDEDGGFDKYRPTPFLFDSVSARAESSFEVYFTLSGDDSAKIYNYGFCVNAEGVTEEWLNYKKEGKEKYTRVFYRGLPDEEMILSGLPASGQDNIRTALEKQVLIVSLGSKLKIDICKSVRDWFLANQFADFGNPVSNYFMSHILPKGFVANKSVQKNVVNFFSSFDNHIKDFRVKKVPQDDGKKEGKYTITALHKMVGSDNMAEIPLGLESAGTLKMFALYPVLQEVLARGSVLFVDELNARLHPLLVRNILRIFLDPKINIYHAQLIFTTHDTWQLANNLLREDEIWFVEKDEEGMSTLYSLADFVDDEMNGDKDYALNYLIGKYGAIPTLKDIDIGEIIDYGKKR